MQLANSQGLETVWCACTCTCSKLPNDYTELQYVHSPRGLVCCGRKRPATYHVCCHIAKPLVRFLSASSRASVLLSTGMMALLACL